VVSDQRLVDHALGQLEVAVMHARNAFREIVTSDDQAANAARVGEITSLLEPIARITEAPHSTFADFDVHLQERGKGTG
jgi:hypothetical protein